MRGMLYWLLIAVFLLFNVIMLLYAAFLAFHVEFVRLAVESDMLNIDNAKPAKNLNIFYIAYAAIWVVGDCFIGALIQWAKPRPEKGFGVLTEKTERIEPRF